MPLIFLLGFYAFLLRRMYAVEHEPDEAYRAPTSDGVELSVVRYRPRGGAQSRAPLLFVHGLGANRFNFDLTRESSLAQYLAEQGYDCWLVDLRGCGDSTVPQGRWNWTFDDHALLDMPAALDLVRDQTGSERVHWIGHSMGGMLLYAYLLRGDASRIASGITLAAPVCFPRSEGVAGIAFLEGLVRRLPQLPVGHVQRLLTPLLGTVGSGLVRMQINVRNMEPAVLQGALYNTAAHLCPGVLAQFLDWLRTGDFRSADGAFSYRDNLHRIETPILVLAGRGDRIVPAPHARLAYERMDAQRCRYMEFCAEAGHCDDYGHADLVFGRRAREEVFPVIADWLRRAA